MRETRNYSYGEWWLKVQTLGFRCVYCGNSVNEESSDREHELSKDHVIPISRGGVDELWNTVPACWRCNNMKQNMTAEEFMREKPALCKHGRKFTQLILSTDLQALAMMETRQAIKRLVEMKSMASQFRVQVRRV